MLTLLLLLARWGFETFGWSFEDLAFYRRAGAAILRGGSPYATPDGVLSFTYPPFAAVSFVPLQLMDSAGSAVFLTALSGLGLYCLLALSSRDLGLTRQHTVVLSLLCCTLEPVLRTLRLGQLNIVLAALVLIDCLAAPPRYRGALVGVAAGLKLTPAILIGWFLLRRDWKAAGVSAVSGSVTVLLEHPAGALVLTVDALTLALGAFAASRQITADRQLAAIAVVGVTGLLISPISWSHHWIWIIPALLVLRSQRRWVLLGVGAGIAYLAPHWWTPAGNLREFHDSWGQQLLCAALPIWGLLFLARMGFVGAPSRARPPRAIVQPTVNVRT